ncbi:Non-homologous end joining protein Ku [Paraconexibacter sp. AEG42_29]|uniref:Non-homologous end joining protein Ku n=1 Tax=Paraconexibacter sp. AEG42_29 TaxID=2997339 RepID=A0AAU7AUZ8_9ACTN
MPRYLWSGSLSFGLINVPIRLVSAVQDRDVHFRQLHEPDGSPIETRRYCSEEEKEVPFEEIGRGYELDDGTLVTLTDEELDAAAPRKSRTIDIEAFVDRSEIDPLLFDHPYVLLPAGETDGVMRAYRLLAEVIDSSDRVALGRVVLRAKEHLVTVGVRDGLLALTTMRFHDELRPAADVDNGGRKPSAAKLKAAVDVVKAMSADWDPGRYEDRHRRRLEDAVAGADRTEDVEDPKSGDAETPDATGARDMMDVLKASLDKARAG